MTEGLKMSTNKKLPELQRQLFLLTRVLLLRLQTTTLTDALRKLWPHLLNELESIFRDNPLLNEKASSKSAFTNKEKQEELALIFEAIKVVELMSALNLEDFQMNQWIFLVDSYGMSPELPSMSDHMQTSGMIPRKDESGGFQVLDKSDAGGIFQPSITRFMQSSVWQFYDQRIMGQEREPTVEEYVRGT